MEAGTEFMVRLLAIVVGMIFTVAQAPVPAHIAAGKATSAAHPRSIADKENPAPLSPSSGLAKDTNTPNDNDQHKSDGQRSIAISKFPPVTMARTGVDWGALANYLLVAVGIGGIIVTVRTLRFIRRQAIEMRRQRILMRRTLSTIERQAQHMEEQVDLMQDQTRILERSVAASEISARAANDNVNTLKNIERAWVVEKIRFPNRIPRQHEMHGGVLGVSFEFKNIGRQPAMIRNIQLRFHTSEGLPSLPEYSAQTFSPAPEIGQNGMLLASDVSIFCSWHLDEGSLDDDERACISGTGRKHLGLYVYGRVRYQSAGLEGINQFCYRWHNLMGFSFEGDEEGFRKSGPMEYNKHS